MQSFLTMLKSMLQIGEHMKMDFDNLIKSFNEFCKYNIQVFYLHLH